VKFGTYSIAARCEKTGKLGIAISTGVPAVGHLCIYARENVGAVVSQSFVNPYLGVWALEYLENGITPDKVIAKLEARDPGFAFRQLGIVNSLGDSTVFTGTKCDTEKGGCFGPNFAIAGNMLSTTETLSAMREKFESSHREPFAERLLAALRAGKDAGGDKRGHQSSALRVVGNQIYPELDLRVDYHPSPVNELEKLYAIAKTSILPKINSLPTYDPASGKLTLHRTHTNIDGEVCLY
jgi:uncharacterized Ntn-hydrolase superfamily protein